MKVFSTIDNLFDRLFIVAGAFIGSQIHQFMQQYTQRLAGHVEALQKLISQLHQMANLSQKNLDQYIQKFKESPDVDFSRQGDFMQVIFNRWEDLNLTLEQLTTTSFWLHPYYFFKNFQSDIASSTLHAFSPGLNLTIEGFSYAALGMIVGWASYKLILKVLTLGYTSAQSLFKQNS